MVGDYFTVTLTFNDGTEEIVNYVSRTHIDKNVLHLTQRSSGMGLSAWETHLGSYPLDGVKKWVRS